MKGTAMSDAVDPVDAYLQRLAADGEDAAVVFAKAFSEGFKAALTKVKPEMRCLEVLNVKADAWRDFVKTLNIQL